MKQTLRRLIHGPTPDELLAQQLALAEIERIQATAETERALANERLLRERVQRLRRELVESAARPEASGASA